MKNISIYILLLILSNLSACNRWPPYEDKALNYFQSHKQGLEDLKNELLKDDLDMMNHTILSGIAKPKEPLAIENYHITPQQREKYAKLIEISGVTNVGRKGPAIYFELIPQAVSGKNYFLSYVYSTEVDLESQACDSRVREQPCGKCSIALSEKWWLEYKWLPKDLDFQNIATVCK